MTDTHGLDPTLDLRLGHRRASIQLHDLATATGLPVTRLRGLLLTLLLTSRCHRGAASACPIDPQPQLPTAEGGTPGREGTERSEPFPKDEKGPETFGAVESERSDAREASGSSSALAEHLARSLGDEGNLPALKRLAERHPEPLLLRALDLTLRVAPERIRRSRGAYFTGVLAILTKPSSSPYDRTPSSPS